jgi:V8-like Glu-specific endopeptidase
MTAVPGRADTQQDADAQGVRMRGTVRTRGTVPAPGMVPAPGEDGQPARARAGGRLRAAMAGAGAAAPVVAVAILGAAILGVAGITPAGHDAGRLAFRLAAAIRVLPRHSAAAARGRPFRGTPAVGALFTTSGGHLADHFCTASVVHSRGGDLLLTAAHCLTGKPIGRDGIVFVPAFHDGVSPYGAWQVTAVFVDSAWSSRHDPDDDVAFLRAGRPGSQIEQATGAERLGVGLPPQQVRVLGYPDAAARPIACQAPARGFGAGQMVFDCDGYADGTSGGPFLAQVSKATGRGTVIGVIGGYQQGGDTPDVSYSIRFLANVAALYKTASRG